MSICIYRMLRWRKVHNYFWITSEYWISIPLCAQSQPHHHTPPQKNKNKTWSITARGLFKEMWPTVLSFIVLCANDYAMQLIFSLTPFVSILFLTLPNTAVCIANPISCRLWTDPQIPGIFMNGDFVIGGIFSIHYYTRSEQNTYTWQPSQLQCSGRSVCGLKRKLLEWSWC